MPGLGVFGLYFVWAVWLCFVSEPGSAYHSGVWLSGWGTNQWGISLIGLLAGGVPFVFSCVLS